MKIATEKKAVYREESVSWVCLSDNKILRQIKEITMTLEGGVIKRKAMSYRGGGFM